MNTYSKYVPNVFLAKCTEKHEKGEEIHMSTKYGDGHDVIVFNLIFVRDGFYYYSVLRSDGFNAQERAKKKAERLQTAAINAESKSSAYFKRSHEITENIPMGQPILVGHHSEKRHRADLEKSWNALGKSVEMSQKAESYESRAEYWAKKANIINLSMPESLEFYEFELEKAKKHHQYLKDNPEARAHSMSLQYANKKIKDIEEKICYALRLWGDKEDIAKLDAEKKEKAEAKASKESKKNDIIKRHSGFFSFNTEQFMEGYNKLKSEGIILDDEKVVHVGYGLYIPKKNVDSFLIEYKK